MHFWANTTLSEANGSLGRRCTGGVLCVLVCKFQAGWGGMATEYSEQNWPRHQFQGKNPKVHVTL